HSAEVREHHPARTGRNRPIHVVVDRALASSLLGIEVRTRRDGEVAPIPPPPCPDAWERHAQALGAGGGWPPRLEAPAAAGGEASAAGHLPAALRERHGRRVRRDRVRERLRW